ncbi:BQ5605_C004g02920 [Microbotryum silenes-dioicae]|uniref:mRNA 3'-end-processing protein RNA14 n=1 Tax=Microbotryum silenes-dioicae TaxID=796604 RepID=A0A2X0M976_9BASI|nr:BQ5605_C004g02920 [Microbotryum silenes-dioicae]
MDLTEDAPATALPESVEAAALPIDSSSSSMEAAIDATLPSAIDHGQDEARPTTTTTTTLPTELTELSPDGQAQQAEADDHPSLEGATAGEPFSVTLTTEAAEPVSEAGEATTPTQQPTREESMPLAALQPQLARATTEDVYDPSTSARASVEPTASSSSANPTNAAPSSLIRAVQAKSHVGLSRVAQLSARIENDPYDHEAQLALLHEVEQKGDLEKTREVYESFLKVFPDAVSARLGYYAYALAFCVQPVCHFKPHTIRDPDPALRSRADSRPVDIAMQLPRVLFASLCSRYHVQARQWISYCDLELSHGLFDHVQDIFIRCLRPSTSIQLWKFYLDFVRRRNPIDLAQPEAAKQARATIAKSFEFALQHVGQDREAGGLWTEYLEFLKEGSVSNVYRRGLTLSRWRSARCGLFLEQGRGSQWEDQQRMDALRKVLQSAVQIPVENVEQIWQEYNAFENNLSKLTAKKFLAELSPAYMTARKALRELRAQFGRLATPALPHQPDWSTPSVRSDLELWKAYLKWEESNPLDLEDPNLLHARVAFAYKKALANMRFFSEIWYLASDYHTRLGKTDEAKTLLENGLKANPGSLLLAYKLVEVEEGHNNLDACYRVYEGLLEHFHRLLTQTVEETNELVAQAWNKLDEEFDNKVRRENGAGEEDDDDSRQKRVQEKDEIKKRIENQREAILETHKKAIASVWVNQMTFARRATPGNEAVKQFRSVFSKARKSPYVTWQVVDASARIEYFWNNAAQVAGNIFEFGMKSFSADPDYVLRYLDFLIMTNNPNNARALFERTVALVEPNEARAVWDRMAQYEYEYGDHLAAQKIAKRFAETFPEVSVTETFARRYGQHGLEAAVARELGTTFSSASGERKEELLSVGGSRATKREASIDVTRAAIDQREASVDRHDYASKRHKAAHQDEPPQPTAAHEERTATGLRPWGRSVSNRAQTPDSEAARGGPSRPRLPDGDIVRRRPPPKSIASPAIDDATSTLNRPVPYKLDAHGDAIAVLPDAVVFFLSILPHASTFTGPFINPATMVDVIATTMLPGTAPGPGLPGERLGIPPRSRDEGGNGGARRGGKRGVMRQASPSHQQGGRGEPDYGYGARPVGGGGGGGGRPRY